jgi:membrane protease subunit (stomatin/prohibitin family)
MFMVLKSYIRMGNKIMKLSDRYTIRDVKNRYTFIIMMMIVINIIVQLKIYQN